MPDRIEKSEASVDIKNDQMISLDYSVVYQIVLFLVLWLILSKLLFRPYLGLLEERERKATGTEHDSTDLEHEGARLRVAQQFRFLLFAFRP